MNVAQIEQARTVARIASVQSRLSLGADGDADVVPARSVRLWLLAIAGSLARRVRIVIFRTDR